MVASASSDWNTDQSTLINVDVSRNYGAARLVCMAGRTGENNSCVNSAGLIVNSTAHNNDNFAAATGFFCQSADP